MPGTPRQLLSALSCGEKRQSASRAAKILSNLHKLKAVFYESQRTHVVIFLDLASKTWELVGTFSVFCITGPSAGAAHLSTSFFSSATVCFNTPKHSVDLSSRHNVLRLLSWSCHLKCEYFFCPGGWLLVSGCH